RYRGPVSSTDLFDARGQTGCLITADGLRLKLRRGVFVPRGESRHSIRAAVRVLDELASPDLRLLDVTLGVGNVVLPLLKRYPHARAWGMDINPTAVALARENADGNGLGQQVGAFEQQDLKDFKPMQGQTSSFHLILANPPYSAEKAERLKNYQEQSESGKSGSLLLSVAHLAQAALAPEGRLVLQVPQEETGFIARVLCADGHLVVEDETRNTLTLAVAK
ncbi:Release factor glutamine methyltransferase (RF MTase) (N5-glutamine methyltransferase PrmC) (Protein-(glutamine-N5) MTase PrmC) (Protein-glutamine N-methyltransferase PrmC), partial [Durusdinium trenchii]